MRKTIYLTILLLGTVFTTNSFADTLLIDSAYQKPEMQRPKKGISKEAVERKFGAPEKKIRAVGDPPISSWVYPEFTVYFEYNHVLHSVLAR